LLSKASFILIPSSPTDSVTSSMSRLQTTKSRWQVCWWSGVLT
jgi:hypothetical protein